MTYPRHDFEVRGWGVVASTNHCDVTRSAPCFESCRLAPYVSTDAGACGGPQVPLIKLPPRLKDVPELKQQDGIKITQKFVDIYDTMINQMNRAIKDLPVLTRPTQ